MCGQSCVFVRFLTNGTRTSSSWARLDVPVTSHNRTAAHWEDAARAATLSSCTARRSCDEVGVPGGSKEEDPMSRRRRVRTAGRIRRQPAALLTLCLVGRLGACWPAAAAAAQPRRRPPRPRRRLRPRRPPPRRPATPRRHHGPRRRSRRVRSPPPRSAPCASSGVSSRNVATRGHERPWRPVRRSQTPAPGGNLAAARLLAVYPRALAAVPPYATVEFKTVVSIRPSAGTNTWGAAGSRSLWMTVTRMSDRSWRVYEFGTGP